MFFVLGLGCAKINTRENNVNGRCAKINPRENKFYSRTQGARKLIRAKISTIKVTPMRDVIAATKKQQTSRHSERM